MLLHFKILFSVCCERNEVSIRLFGSVMCVVSGVMVPVVERLR